VGVSFTWRIARIPDLSCYASYVMGAAAAVLAYQRAMPLPIGLLLPLGIGVLIGAIVFALWRWAGMNILLVGVLMSYLGFSGASAIMRFNALGPTSALLVKDAAGRLPIGHHCIAVGVAFLAIAALFESSWGSNLFVWSRSRPLATGKWIRSVRSPDLLALGIGNVCTAVSGFLMAQDHGEFNLQEGKELLFIALVALVVGETLVIILRSIGLLIEYGFRRARKRPGTAASGDGERLAVSLRNHRRFLRQRFGWAFPLSLVIAAPLGAVVYWLLVNLSDEVLEELSAAYFSGRDLSGLSSGIVALMAIVSLSLLHVVRVRETLYEPWRFRG
jgi:putative tryptophan/tyrosine transport system permease protein